MSPARFPLSQESAVCIFPDFKILVECPHLIPVFGSGKEITIARLAELVKEAVGFKGEIHWDASKPDGTMRKLTDVSKLHSLGWHHKVEIEDGVPALYRWYLAQNR